MRNLLFSSALLVILLQSCSPYTQQFTKREKTLSVFTPSFLFPEEIEHTFKADISAYGHQTGGILVLKKLAPAHFRLALLSEFGGTLLDVELIEDELKLNHAIPPFQRKAVLHTLKKDFLILLNEQAPVKGQFSDGDHLIYQSPYGNGHIYYHVREDNQLLTKATYAGRHNERVSITYTYIHHPFPDVNIAHADGSLNIFLSLLEEEVL